LPGPPDVRLHLGGHVHRLQPGRASFSRDSATDRQWSAPACWCQCV